MATRTLAYKKSVSNYWTFAGSLTRYLDASKQLAGFPWQPTVAKVHFQCVNKSESSELLELSATSLATHETLTSRIIIVPWERAFYYETTTFAADAITRLDVDTDSISYYLLIILEYPRFMI